MRDVGGVHPGVALRSVSLDEDRWLGYRPVSGEGNCRGSRRTDRRREQPRSRHDLHGQPSHRRAESDGTGRRPLRDAVARSVFWIVWSRGGLQIVSFATTILVARLLSPADYGLAAM